MNKVIKIFLVVAIGVLIFFLASFMYLKLIYYPNNKNAYTVYRVNKNYYPEDIRYDPFMVPPAGGCSDICWGEEVQVKCDVYSPQYNKCEMECLGPHYNNCSSGKIEVFVNLIYSKFTR